MNVSGCVGLAIERSHVQTTTALPFRNMGSFIYPALFFGRDTTYKPFSATANHVAWEQVENLHETIYKNYFNIWPIHPTCDSNLNAPNRIGEKYYQRLVADYNKLIFLIKHVSMYSLAAHTCFK